MTAHYRVVLAALAAIGLSALHGGWIWGGELRELPFAAGVMRQPPPHGSGLIRAGR